MSSFYSLIFLILAYLNAFFCDDKFKLNIRSDKSYSVALTTIPPRFSSVHHTLLSWLRQDERPLNIMIFIPKTYKRFKRKKPSDTTMKPPSYYSLLMNNLMEHEEIRRNINENVIKIIELDKDYGPATKFVGLLYMHNNHRDTNNNYWILCDDDVYYAKSTWSSYNIAISIPLIHENTHDYYKNLVLTHFSEDNRMKIRISGEFLARAITHIQGVDTVLIPSDTLSNQLNTTNILTYKSTVAVLNYMHNVCPDSFYQDDYILSFMLNVANITVRSIWNNFNVASHIEGVSKSNSQMHMNSKVFEREQNTKDCLVYYTDMLYHTIIPGTISRAPTPSLEL